MSWNPTVHEKLPGGSSSYGCTTQTVFYNARSVTLKFEPGTEQKLNQLATDGVAKEQLYKAIIALNGNFYGDSLVVTDLTVSRLDNEIKSKMSRGMQKTQAVYQIVSGQSSFGYHGGTMGMGGTSYDNRNPGQRGSTVSGMGATSYDNRTPGQRGNTVSGMGGTSYDNRTPGQRGNTVSGMGGTSYDNRNPGQRGSTVSGMGATSNDNRTPGQRPGQSQNNTFNW
jgi:hypothetical protein